MGEYETGRLIYLVLLGGALLAYLLVANRGQMGTLLRGALLWVLIFVGVVAAVGLWEDLRDRLLPGRAVSFGEGRIEVPRDPSGHFYVTLTVQGTPVRFVVDTGATHMVLSRRDAQRMGIDPAALVFSGRAQTANGMVRTARVSLGEVAFGSFLDSDVIAWVNEGEMDLSLLGMSYLSRFERIQIERGRLVLMR